MGCAIELHELPTQSRGWNTGSAEPFITRRRLLLMGKDWICAPIGLPGVEELARRQGVVSETGMLSCPANTYSYGKATPYNQQGKSGGGQETGS